MLKPTELRIGNLVTQIIERSTHNEEKTITIEWQELMWISRDRVDYYKPIPLTEEWLLKFGFYKNIDTELFEKDGHQIDLSVIKCLFYLPEFGDWYKELEYVHQLQNLYFALTNEELTLTK
jgi:hypothetical protein